MQKILGYLRKCIQEFEMIQDGDRIAVGVSGGKDSLVLLKGLVMLRNFIGISYDVTAITVDPGFGGIPGNYEAVEDLCSELGISYNIIPTHIGEIVFNIRNEKSPCSLCARMRRGALNNSISELNCNKLALGHNLDDAVETFMMNLLTEGRIGCFSPVTHLEDRELTIIRPLLLAPEKEIRRAAKRTELPVISSGCPADGNTHRQEIKEFIAELERKEHGVKKRIFGAIRRSGIDGWK